MKRRKRPALKSRINSALRNIWRFSEQRKEALAAAKVSRGRYACALCGHITGPKGIQVNHIEPVVDPVRGRQGWDVYIDRLFCPPEGLQALCKGCHEAETAKQRKAASEAKKRGKEC